MSDTWLWMSAAELGRGIERGAIDPRDLAEAYLAAIEAHPEGAGIYARLTETRARAESAAAADRAARGLRRGPLDGVPLSWKDLYDTAGIETGAGSALLHGRIPASDARVLQSATRAGTVCLGKTHMTELAFAGLGVNPSTATPPNINDPELAPGGSSSGAATSVAFGLASAAIGSDTGGSVRVPAAWNDLVGLKTTHGLLPLEGVVPLCPRFDTIGPLCRTVEDAALVTAVLAAAPVPDLAGASLEGRRLLVLDTAAMGPTAPEIEAAFETALGALEAAGARLTRASLPSAEAAMPLAARVFTAEAYACWGDTIEANPDAMFHQVRVRFLAGKDVSAADYIRGWMRLGELRAAYRDETAAHDAVLLPTTPNLPPPVDRLLDEDDYYVSENLLTLRNTRIANLLGLSALTLPTGTPSIGLMAMAAPFAEAALLRLGAAMERALA